MKRYWISIFFVSILFISNFAFGGQIGALSFNVAEDKDFGIAGAGLVGFSQREVSIVHDQNKTDTISSTQFNAKFTVGPIKYVDVYGIFGGSDLRENDGQFDGLLGTTFGIGLRPQIFPLIWRDKINTKIRIALDGQYREIRTSDDTTSGRLLEGQGALIISYVTPTFVPYGGMKYDWAKVLFSGNPRVADNIISSNKVGAFLGTDYFVTPEVFFSAELSIFTETGLYLAVGYRWATDWK